MYFADILEYCDDHLEITNMESGQCQSDMTKVSVALLQSFATSLAEPRLARNAHPSVERSICGNCPFFLEVVQGTVTDFEDTLVDYVLGGTCIRSDITSCPFPNATMRSYRIPNLSSFILLGTVSTTCSFTDSPTAATDCMLTSATVRQAPSTIFEDAFSTWMRRDLCRRLHFAQITIESISGGSQ